MACCHPALQTAKEQALNGPALLVQGLPGRASVLLRLGLTFFLGFAPFILVVGLLFGGIYLVRPPYLICLSSKILLLWKHCSAGYRYFLHHIVSCASTHDFFMPNAQRLNSWHTTSITLSSNVKYYSIVPILHSTWMAWSEPVNVVIHSWYDSEWSNQFNGNI